MPFSNTSQAISPASGCAARQRPRVLAAAETHLQPQGAHRGRERGARIIRLRGGEAQAGQRHLQQAALARPQRVAAGAAIEAVGRGLECAAQRPSAVRSAGTRSVRSHENRPSSSGARPKWP